MNFATLQGLTIPEGVVTQIADASGRVLWSARKAVIDTFYLRPNADISVEHELYPANSTTAYLLINEEVSDDSATYIFVTDAENDGQYTVAESHFSLSGSIPDNLISVTSLTLSLRFPSIYGLTAVAGYSVFVDGVEIDALDETAVSTIYLDFELSETVVTAINQYIVGHKAFPNLSIIIKTGVNSTSSKGSTLKLSQAYLAVECKRY